MSQAKFYFDGSLWVYSDGVTIATKTAPKGNYSRSTFETKVCITGKENNFSIFKDGYVEVTEIQKSATLGDNYTSIVEFNEATVLFFGEEVTP